MTETSDDKAHPLVGQVVSERYRIEALLGEGGMGAVFRATHISLDRPVAVKVLHPRLSADEQIGKRFDREALAVSKLDHPNCVQVIDFGTTRKGMKYLVMQYLEGRELRDLTGVSLPIEQVVDFGLQILRALEHAHKRGLVHRDLKPENIFLVEDDDGRTIVKLVDFGIVKLLEGDGMEKLTRMGMAFGTPTYMSPEQAAGGKIDPRTDLYAVGVLLYELLTGAPPFDADEPGILLRMHILADPPPLPDSVPNAVAGLVMKLLSKEPDERYQDAREARRALTASYRLPTRTTGQLGVASPLPAPNLATDPPADVPTAAEPQAQAPTDPQAQADTRAEVPAPAIVPAPPAAFVVAPAPPPPDAELFAPSGGTVVADASMSHGAAPVAIYPPSASMSHGSAPMSPMSSGVAAFDPLAVSSAHVPRMPPPSGLYSSGAHPMSGAYPVLPPPSTRRGGKRRSPVAAIVIGLILLTWVIIGAVWLSSRDGRPDARPGATTPSDPVAAPGEAGLQRVGGGEADRSADLPVAHPTDQATPTSAAPPTAVAPPREGPSFDGPPEGKGRGGKRFKNKKRKKDD